jgi:ABC-type antimicrobial peptide transport system permease subunit
MSVRKDNFKLAYQSLKSAKARSFLTMLGFVIAVAAVVLISCIGQGVKKQISGQLGRYGKSVIAVTAGAPDGGSSPFGGIGAGGNLLSENDLRTIQKDKGVDVAVPIASTTGSIKADHTIAAPFIIATDVEFPKVINVPLQYGGFFDPDAGSKSAVLGDAVAHKLFDDNAPLGQSFTWRGQKFIVAGVFNSFNASPFSAEANFDDAVFIPYSTAQSLSGSVLSIYQVFAKTKSPEVVPATLQSVKTALMANHGDTQDFTIERASEISNVSDRSVHLLTVLVTGAALIALLVGGVGIMDVMLVSVTERMHEIGLRKAIGATNQQIMRQFMAEAFLLSTMGAIIGILLALAVMGFLHFFSSLQAVMVWQSFVIAPLATIAVGMFFGTIPALKAARKDPIEALRHE